MNKFFILIVNILHLQTKSHTHTVTTHINTHTHTAPRVVFGGTVEGKSSKHLRTRPIGFGFGVKVQWDSIQ